jgi:hypothetical protein
MITTSLSSNGLTLTYSEREVQLLKVGVNNMVEIAFRNGRDSNSADFMSRFRYSPF